MHACPRHNAGGSPTGLLASLKAIAHIPSRKQQAGGEAEPAAAQGAAGPAVPGEEGPGLGERLSRGFKSMLERGKEEEGASAAGVLLEGVIAHRL